MNAHAANPRLTFLPRAGAGAVAPRGHAGFAGRVAAALLWLAGMPKRRAVIAELSRLSDHDLADIGLSRGDLPRVFDAAFVASRCLASKAGN
jgi:uncharacterized protein YjiS (DUF1127 family)